MLAVLPQAGSPRDPARRSLLPGPEPIGMLLSIVVLAVVGAFLAPDLLGTGVDPTASPLPTAGAGGATVTPATAAPATRPPWAHDASTLIDVDERLLSLGETLVEQSDPRPTRADDLARTMRSINTQLAVALPTIDRMESAGMPEALVDDLRAAHEAALDASVSTLRASQSNVDAYLAGAEAIGVELARIEALQPALAAESDGSGAPSP
ncbi:MAG: hypothetical protein ACLGIJ_09195 [Candidatus Limnocylindria bacterium]